MTSNAWHSPTDLLGEATLYVGDLVRTGENFHPHYRVIAVAEDRIWMRDTHRGSDHIVPINGCRKIEDGGA